MKEKIEKSKTQLMVINVLSSVLLLSNFFYQPLLPASIAIHWDKTSNGVMIPDMIVNKYFGIIGTQILLTLLANGILLYKKRNTSLMSKRYSLMLEPVSSFLMSLIILAAAFGVTCILVLKNL